MADVVILSIKVFSYDSRCSSPEYGGIVAVVEMTDVMVANEDGRYGGGG